MPMTTGMRLEGIAGNTRFWYRKDENSRWRDKGRDFEKALEFVTKVLEIGFKSLYSIQRSKHSLGWWESCRGDLQIGSARPLADSGA